MRAAMIVLGFDTATPATAVGLRLADGATLQRREDPRAGERPGHTTQLLPLAGELLAQADLRWGELDRIAVGVGPGTFTGLRIGIATARGLAQSLGVDVVGISTLWVLAEASLRGSQVPPRQGVLAAIDARRGEVFAAAYLIGGEPGQAVAHGRAVSEADGVAREPRVDGVARELIAPRACAPQELAGLLEQAGEPRRWLAVGDGAVRYRGHLEALAVAVPADSSPLHQVDAGVLCELSLSVSPGACEAVLPDYRRRPDAEIALQARAET